MYQPTGVGSRAKQQQHVVRPDTAQHCIQHFFMGQRHGNHNMGEFELAVGVLHIALLTPHMDLLENARNGYYSTTVTRWGNFQSTTHLAVSCALFRQRAFLLREHTVTARVTFLPGDGNVITDTASRWWDLTNTALLDFFYLHFSQSKSWSLCLVSPDMNQRITSALRNGRNGTASSPAGTVLALPPGKNGWT